MDSTPTIGTDILDSINSSDAMKILRILMERNKELKTEIRKIALEILSDANPEEIAVDVMQALDCIEVEELWDRSGSKRYGYIDPSEESWVMFEEALIPFLNTMTKYQKIGLTNEAKAYCVGIILGIQGFEADSHSEFKDWAVDAPQHFIEEVFEKWKSGNPCEGDVIQVRAIL